MASSATETPAPPVRVGDILDHYRIEALAARSGMASIFRATELRDGLQVAIKLPHPEMEADEIFLDRFRREEEIGLTLNHPGVMKVFDDEVRSRPYMVMEWLEGVELRKFLGRVSKLAAERAVAIALDICKSLEYIHSHGVVHRDLKPENIMVTAGDRTKLIDFGIAGKAGSRRLTFGSADQIMGSPDYIAPEQINRQPGDARSDIYALGVIFYEMLTGETPFRGSSPFVVMNDRLVNNPIPPREINPEISPELQEIVYRALARDPAKRYSSASEFAWDLAHHDAVDVADRAELTSWDPRHTPLRKKVLLYAGILMVPVVVFALMLMVAGR